MTAQISNREHARLARELVEACGGPAEALASCRIKSKSQLCEYGLPHFPATMPADVIADLERHCGQPIYSQVLFERCEAQTAAGDIKDIACTLTELTADLQRTVRKAIADEKLSPNEHNAIDEAIDATRDTLAKLEGAKRAAETQRPNLKAV